MLGSPPGVEVRIGLATLLGLDDHPAELAGWGPIDALDARLLVDRQHDAEWRFAVVDDHGYLVLGGVTRRRPPRTAGVQCRGGVVEIHVRAELLTDLARCADLPPGWAGIVADIADQYLDRHAALRKLDGDPHARFPGTGLRRHVQMRDRSCVAPGCRRPARKADQDHTVDYQRGGTTVRANLDPLCGRDHPMKHDRGWTLTQPRPGRFRWRSPLGNIYWTRGEPIAPDLPEPEPGPDDGGDIGILNLEDRRPGPIFDRHDRRKRPPPAPEPPPPEHPSDDVDEPPPF